MPEITQTLNSDTDIIVEQSQTITSDTNIEATLSQFITGNSNIIVAQTQSIFSDTEILVQEVELKLFKESDLSTEVGTEGNPIAFGSIEAGSTIVHSDNPFVLFNDKGGTLQSVDARDVTVTVIRLDVVDELLGSSDGSPSQTFSVAFPPLVNNSSLIVVKVQDVAWTRVFTFSGSAPTDEVCTIDATTGQITFGDGFQGKIPPNGNTIKASYSLDTILFGKQAAEQLWIGVQSFGVISNPVSVTLERRTPTDLIHVTTAHKPISAVTGVFLIDDPNRLGTNFFTSGTFDAANGIITLGTSLPDLTKDVLIDYSYAIADDLEGGFSQMGNGTSHSFANPIPRNNAKKLNFRAVIPSSASPSGIDTIRFKLRISYKQ